MRIKRVHAPDIQTALERVRAELGPDAVIIATRPLGETPEERRRGLTGVELVAGVDDQAPVSAVAQARQVAQGASGTGVAPAAARAAYTLAMTAGQEPTARPTDAGPTDRAGRNGSRARLPGVPLGAVHGAHGAEVRRPAFPRLSRGGAFADELERLVPAREALAARRHAAEGDASAQRAALLDLIRAKHEEFVAAGRPTVPSYVPGTGAAAASPPPALMSDLPSPPDPLFRRAGKGENENPLPQAEEGLEVRVDGREERPTSPAHAAAVRAFERLCAAGLGEGVAEEAVTAAIRAATRAALADADRLLELALTCLARALPPAPALEADALAGRVLLFVGPAGAGKTTALLKAALHLRRAGAGVVLAGADVSRLGALEQLQRYGALLGLPVRPVYEPDDLVALLTAPAEAGGQITLVDTPACGPTPAEHEELSELIRAAATPMVVVTVAAGTGEGELRRLAATARALAATAVAVTRLDETEAPAAPLHVAAALRLPLLLCSAGRDVTDGLRTPTPDELAAAVLEQLRPVADAA